MRKVFYFIVLALALVPLALKAHVKWFAESIETIEPYSITDGPVLIWIGIVLALVLVGVFLEKKLRVPNWLKSHISKWGPKALSLASIGFGVAFLIFSWKGFIFAPNLVPSAGMENLLLLQAIAGAMILLGLYERIGALLILVLFVLGIKEFGAFEMLDTLEMVGFAGYAFIIGRPKWRVLKDDWLDHLVKHLKSYGVPLLRVGTGLNLMILGFTEKILTPGLTADFLSNYDWNFMASLGMSDYWFAFSAGAVEFTFGLFFLLGLITRINTLALAVFLVITLSLLGPTELIGHLPHFSIAIALLVLGSGDKFKLHPKIA